MNFQIVLFKAKFCSIDRTGASTISAVSQQPESIDGFLTRSLGFTILGYNVAQNKTYF